MVEELRQTLGLRLQVALQFQAGLEERETEKTLYLGCVYMETLKCHCPNKRHIC